MLTEEEVKRMEQQRELRDRAYKTMSWNERKRFDEAQEREMYDERYRASHGGMSRAEVAAAGPDGSGRQNAAIKRGFELQAQREFEQKRLGEELGTRRFEAEQRRFGMREQGRDAAEFNKDAAIRTAELQTASAQKIAGMNAASNEKIAGINTASAEKINEDRNKSAEEVATINKEGNVEAAAIQARAQAAKEYAEGLRRQRLVDDKTALEFSQKRSAMITQLINSSKQHGKPKYTEEQAARIIDERLKSELPGKPRKFQF